MHEATHASANRQRYLRDYVNRHHHQPSKTNGQRLLSQLTRIVDSDFDMDVDDEYDVNQEDSDTNVDFDLMNIGSDETESSLSDREDIDSDEEVQMSGSGNQSDDGEGAGTRQTQDLVFDNWSTADTEPPLFTFDDSHAGMQIQIPPNADPGFFFSLIVSDDLIEHMVIETNRYADQVLAVNRPMLCHSRLNDWKPTNNDEMKVFLGLLLQMGPVVLPTLSHYWSKNELYKTALWRRTMSRDRFLLLLRFWHFANNRDPLQGRLQKVAPILDHFNSVMSSVYKPARRLSLDESMVLWRGRLLFRQYIKNKRHKYGIKFFELAESNGMILRLCIYSGEAFEDVDHLGQPGAIVCKLMADYLDKGHVLFTDNYYNSVTLTEKMTERSTYIVGTLRSDRKRNPLEVVKKKLKKGEHEWRRSGSVVVCKWKDKRDVLMISNMHKVEMVPVTNRHAQEKMKPNILRDYNNGMSGVDKSDQMLSYYSALRKTIRWYKKVVLHIVEMAIHNAHIMYNDGKPAGQQLRLLTFREAVVKSLVGHTPEVDEQPTARAAPHVPSKIPPTEKKQIPTKRCRICTKNNRRRETRYYCGDCEGKPALCVSPCFGMYHAQRL